MAPGSTRLLETCSPAPYGRACAGCTRAKQKCFYRTEGSECERLMTGCSGFRVARSPSRKRKAGTPPPPAPSRLEEKLDDLVSLLRSQAVEKPVQAPQDTPQPTSKDSSTPSTLCNYDDSASTNPAQDPDIVLDTTAVVVELLRPASPRGSASPVADDVSGHGISDRLAETQLATFRRAFIPMLPFVHMPASMSSSELRRQKPFLWLVVISLTTPTIAKQFSIEETIWHIISRRIVCQQLANLDLLLGVVCFASWSHVFKKDKPFMCMLSQLAVSLAFEIGIHHDVPTNTTARSQSTRNLSPQGHHLRTTEERRTILAVFHLTSWKTEPLRWTPYMEDCLRIVGEGTETPMDTHLATHVECQIIMNQLTCSRADQTAEEGNLKAQPAILTTALLGQINDIRQRLPVQIRTELTIQESLLNQPRAQTQTGLSHIRRLQDLDSVLTSVERWLTVFFEMNLNDWVGVNVDNFTQFTHCLVVLFKLTLLDERGWDLEEVKRRADVFDILDRSCEIADRVPGALGMVDADGPRRGLFFKITHIFQAIKALFLAEMARQRPTGTLQTPAGTGGSGNAAQFVGEASVPDDLFLNLSDEPWLSDIFDSSWELRTDDSLDGTFAV
ncbi:hypothetical protein BJ170DRAFT_598978 [Xylariales sp. AK1849]|nr:hypothetical protein BJ170DRAFT_598978 [Xylariales sp. AK1849]